MTAANIFLCQDFEYTVRICSTNFSYVANTSLFEGNILRIKSLAQQELFNIRQNQEFFGDEEERSRERKQRLQVLLSAIDAARNALSIYS